MGSTSRHGYNALLNIDNDNGGTAWIEFEFVDQATSESDLFLRIPQFSQIITKMISRNRNQQHVLIYRRPSNACTFS